MRGYTYSTPSNPSDTRRVVKFTPSPIRRNRTERLTRWVHLLFALLVARCGAWLADGGVLSPRALDSAVRLAGKLALIHAGDLRGANAPRGSGTHRHGRLNSCWAVRKLIGARVRQAMRGDDFGARLHAILSFVRDIAFHARRLLRRLCNGLDAPAHP